MNAIAERIVDARKRMNKAAIAAGRTTDSVNLLAVSKTRSADEILQAYHAGQLDFGENYLQEALDKQQLLHHYKLVWHFIGPIQSNKTRAIAENFDWVHSVDRFKIAKRLSDQRPENTSPLNICLQVNVSEESSKSGILLPDLPQLAAEIIELPRLRLRGLMAIPARIAHDETRQRIPFRILKETVEQLQKQGYSVDTLSMGMTDDLEAAIAEGATWIRLGRAIFGKRENNTQPN